jgi:hypothetical protein
VKLLMVERDDEIQKLRDLYLYIVDMLRLASKVCLVSNGIV